MKATILTDDMKEKLTNMSVSTDASTISTKIISQEEADRIEDDFDFDEDR